MNMTMTIGLLDLLDLQEQSILERGSTAPQRERSQIIRDRVEELEKTVTKIENENSALRQCLSHLEAQAKSAKKP